MRPKMLDALGECSLDISGGGDIELHDEKLIGRVFGRDFCECLRLAQGGNNLVPLREKVENSCAAETDGRSW